MKLVAVILLTSLLYANAAYGAVPCAADDSDCLLKLTLRQTYDLEAAQKENAILRQNLDEEIKRADSGPKFFLLGMLAGVVFVGLSATLAMKAIHEASK